jgi:precorrin-6Y C5,15-methyltransferase (decarboxylating)
VVGGARHLTLAASLIGGESLAWPRPIEAALPIIAARRGRPVAVLASGDPFCFGIGSLLAGHFPAAEWRCLPAPSCFTLACALLGWGMQDCATISFCGRPIAALAPLLQPGARVLALSADAATPERVALYLAGLGFGATTMHVLEALGGPAERHRTAMARDFALAEIHALNLLALEIAAEPGARPIPLTAGLDDWHFAHDGQITKCHVRAVTLAALAPLRGEILWDIGSGSGSIGIEWMLRHPANRAYGIEKSPIRAARAAENAVALGVPGLRVIEGAAPGALRGLPPPDAVFIGGGAHLDGVIAAAWQALAPRGRLVANAVTLESEAALLAARAQLGGSLSRISVERMDHIGAFHAFRPAMTVTQFVAVKP